MSTLCAYCFLGVLASTSFEDMADALYESDWIEFPVSMQTDLIIMIAHMQKPIYYSGFGIVEVDLITFVTVRLILKAD